MYRNMTDPKLIQEVLDSIHPSDMDDYVFPVGFCETPDYDNVRCPITFNSSEQIADFDAK